MMGNCLAVEHRGVPRCEKCGKDAYLEWVDLTFAERATWRWEDPNGPCLCEACASGADMEQSQFDKQRSLYKKIKQDWYPRSSHPSRLRRIESEEEWCNGKSFHASWRWAGRVLRASSSFYSFSS